MHFIEFNNIDNIDNIDNSFISEKVNDKLLDPVCVLVDDLILEVFSYFNFSTLGTICLASKEWKRLACDDTLWKKKDVYEKAINNKKWAQWFGEEVVKDEDLAEEWASLPWNIAGILESRCPIYPEKRVGDTHILVRLPKTLNGGLTLKSLGKLAKKWFTKSNSDTDCEFIWPYVVEELRNKSIDKSRWVMMTKDGLPGSTNKSSDEQEKMIALLAEKALGGCEVPEALESAACILSHYFDSNIHLFSDNPRTYTRCKDNDSQTAVGGFGPDSFIIDDNSNPRGCPNICVAALYRYPSQARET